MHCNDPNANNLVFTIFCILLLICYNMLIQYVSINCKFVDDKNKIAVVSCIITENISFSYVSNM